MPGQKLWVNNGGILGEMLESTRSLLRRASSMNALEPELMDATETTASSH